MAGNVVGRLENRDKHTFEVLTGKLEFYADHWGGKRFFAAVKTAPHAKGNIRMLPTGGRLSIFTITNTGSGYTSIPTVTISGGGGSGATAKASIWNGQVRLITLIQRGNGYTTAPTVTISGGGGSGATATVSVTATEPSIDASKALAVTGVQAVVNFLDVRVNSTTNVTLLQTFNYWGAPVAAVIADDWHTAVYATGLIDIEYETLPWVTDPVEALKPTAPSAGNTVEGSESPNLAIANYTVRPANLTDAQFETALTACDAQVTYRQGFTTCYAHNMLEPHGQTAWWVGDHCYIWTGSQNLHSAHTSYITALGRSAISPTVHTFTQGTGGGHGDKTGGTTGGLCARLSQFVDGAPVTLIGTRNTNITMFNRQSGSEQYIRIGGNRDGKIMAFETTGHVAGASGGGGALTLTGIQQSFNIPTYRGRARALYTNTPSRGPWRCVGDPPAAMGYDAAIDLLANALGGNLTPYQLRMNNLRDSSMTPLASQSRYYALALPAMLKRVHDDSGYTGKWHAPKTNNVRDGRRHGIGISTHVDGHGSVNGGGRYISLTANNVNNVPHAFIHAGFARGPSGAPSAIASIVAERMGLSYDNVFVADFGKTDKTWPSGNQAGSGFTSGAGGAAYNAADKARKEILTAALGNTAFANLDVPSGRVRATATATISNGIVASISVVNGGSGYTGNPRVSFSGGGGSGATAVANVVSGRVVSIGITNPGANYTEAPTVTVGWLSMEDLDPRDNTIYLNASVGGTTSLAISSVLNTTSMGWWDQGWGTPSGFSSAGSSASCAEVLVDEETGEVEVTGIWNVVDTGGTIFKRGAIKEMLSGCELIIAQTLFFGDIYDHAHSGALIGTMYSQSQTPTSMDLPCNNYHVFDYESNDCGPYGAHGIGEPAVSCVSAIYGAIYNAIGVFPDPEHGALNPDRVLKALGKA